MEHLREKVEQLLARASAVRVLVVGDVMLDEYISGSATRISPEAPVPVVAVRRRRSVPGGAANVAANVAGVGAKVALAGVIGADEPGQRLRNALLQAGLQPDWLVEDAGRVTTTKTRVTAGGQQIVRFDSEDTSPLAGVALEAVRTRCSQLLREVQVCVISDYAKGTVEGEFCHWLIGEAVRLGLPVVVDPKSRDLARYAGATVITPNLKETAAAAGAIIDSQGLHAAVEVLLPQIGSSALLVTRGEEGMSLFEQATAERHYAAMVNEVADVTGAGDTVVGMLAVALGAGLLLRDAAAVANLAAGIAVSHHGTWAVSAAELRAAAG